MIACRPVFIGRGAIRIGAWSLAVITLSCRQVVGIGDEPSAASGSTTACGVSQGTSACAACASAHCCAASTACQGEPLCEAFESCLGQCKGDVKCREQCAIDHPATSSNVSALSVCLASSCLSECGLTCGAFAGYPVEPDAAVSCQQCIESNACTLATACARSAACDQDDRCHQACTSVGGIISCQDGCDLAVGVDPSAYIERTDAGGLVQSFVDTFATGCRTACASGGYWECLGHVSFPFLQVATSDFHFWTFDYASGAGVPGANVKACALGDPLCTSSALPSTNTDSTGHVQMTLPVGGISGTAQGMGLGFWLEVTAPGYVTNYTFWNFALAQPALYTYGELVSPAAYAQYASNTGVTQDPERGYLNVVAYDCTGQFASDVRVSVEPSDDRTVSTTLSAVVTNVTDNQGVLTFFNVPAGNVTITTTALAAHRTAGQASVLVAKGTASTVSVFPSPMP
jgi:hypothetical protein